MSEILKLYDQQVRQNPTERAGLKIIRDNYLTRLEGPYDFVSWWTLTEDNTKEVIKSHVEYFRSNGRSLMWRVYEHDKPNCLPDYLRALGFTAHEEHATLMVLDLEAEIPSPKHAFKQVNSIPMLKEYLSVADAAFGFVPPNDFDFFSKQLNDPNFALFLGYQEKDPAVSGRLEMQDNSSFGILFGGAVKPAYQKKGLFTSLVHHRAKLAKARGKRYLSTEAYNTSSRPIFKKLGFQELSMATTWVLSV